MRTTKSIIIALALTLYTSLASAQTNASRACPPDLQQSCSVVNTWFNLVVALTNAASPESLRLAGEVCGRLDREAAGLEQAFHDHTRTQTGSADQASGAGFTSTEGMRPPGIVETARRFCRDLRGVTTTGTAPAALSSGDVDIASYTAAVVETTNGRITAGDAMQHAVDAMSRRPSAPSPARGSRRARPSNSPGMCREPPSNGPPAPSPPPG